MVLLVQFVFRMTLGMAAAMFLTSGRQVSAGFFRVHLYVLLGLAVLAAAAKGISPEAPGTMTPAIVAAVLSYVGSICWLYQSRLAGKSMLAALVLVGMWGAWAARSVTASYGVVGLGLAWLDPITSGWLLGTTMVAMLLGHWYLNNPEMHLEPLKRLVLLMGTATVLRALVAAGALAWLTTQTDTKLATLPWAMLALRWAFGIAATAVLIVMTWATLKIPNTQSATGILYVAVITTFLGELSGQLIAAQLQMPGL